LKRFLPWRANRAKDGAITFDILLASNNRIDCVLAKTAEGVVLEVGRRRLVFRVLKAPDDTSASLALRSSTRKDVTRSAFEILKGNIGFEEGIDRGAPSLFERI
jgi:hypothetical protein